MNMENKKRRAALGDVSNDEKIQNHGPKRKCSTLETNQPAQQAGQKGKKASANVESDKSHLIQKTKSSVEVKLSEKTKEGKLQKPATQRKSCYVSKLCSPIQKLYVEKKSKGKSGEKTNPPAYKKLATTKKLPASTSVSVNIVKTIPINIKKVSKVDAKVFPNVKLSKLPAIEILTTHTHQHKLNKTSITNQTKTSTIAKASSPSKTTTIKRVLSPPQTTTTVQFSPPKTTTILQALSPSKTTTVTQVSYPQKTSQSSTWVDIDAENTSPTSRIYYMSEYINDIFEYIKQKEMKHRISGYMQNQPQIDEEMRRVLVDWLVEVQQSFEFNHETLYIAVKLLDTYASRKAITKKRLQLIGAVSLNLAAKFEERCPPSIDDFLYICDDAYTKDDFLQGEVEVLMVVDFNLSIPLSYTFLRRYALCGKVNTITLTLSRYILESSLLYYHLITFLESKMAAASLFIAIAMTNETPWNGTLVHYTGYTPMDLINEVSQLNNTIFNTPPGINTILNKYSHPIFQQVALIPKLTTEKLVELAMLD